MLANAVHRSSPQVETICSRTKGGAVLQATPRRRRRRLLLQRHDAGERVYGPRGGHRGSGGWSSGSSVIRNSDCRRRAGGGHHARRAARHGRGGEEDGKHGKGCDRESLWQIDHAFPGTRTCGPGLSARESAVCATQHLRAWTIGGSRWLPWSRGRLQRGRSKFRSPVPQNW